MGRLPIVLVSSVALLLAACTGSGDDAASDADQPVSVRVMQFNIEYGGTVVDFDSVPAAIEAADADVVALQEAYGNTCRVAEAVGWDYCDRRTQTISRFPLVTPDVETSPEVLVAVAPGQVFGVVNVHLPSSPYGPNRAAAGASADELVAGEKGRLRALEDPMRAVMRLEGQGIPVVLIGDFNTPSHRDWTDATDGLRDHVSPVEWPVTVAIEEAGLTDAYRTVYPDPVEDEGLTWPASRPKAGSYNPGPSGKPEDRIDMTFVSDDIDVQSAEIVGEKSSPVTDIAVEPWPTDHRGVVFGLDVATATSDPYVALARRLVARGDSVPVMVYADPMPSELTVDSDLASLTTDVDAGGAATVATELFEPGSAEVAIDNAGDQLASATLWISEPDMAASISTKRATYREGEPISVTWENAPGNKWDWIGVYRQGADPNVAWYKNWVYTDAQIAGTALIDGQTPGGPWPLPPGEYDVVLLEDDSYQELARAPFTVRR